LRRFTENGTKANTSPISAHSSKLPPG
jgi:hypothetical protein